MRVQFLKDFRGRATNEEYYVKGQIVDIPDDVAFACFAEDAAAMVVDEEDARAPDLSIKSPSRVHADLLAEKASKPSRRGRARHGGN